MPAVVAGEALAFLLTTRPSLAGPHHDKWYVYNMDQTPLWFSYHRSKTLQKKGVKTVNVRKSTNDTQLSYCCFHMHRRWHFLRPMIISKGTAAAPTKCIDGREVHACLGQRVSRHLPPTSSSIRQRHAGSSSRFLQMPHDELGHPCHPGVGDQGDQHPRQLHGFAANA